MPVSLSPSLSRMGEVDKVSLREFNVKYPHQGFALYSANISSRFLD
ncbi:MAG: hypothetical protein WAW10_11575 [Gallionella sp.]